MSLPTYYGNVSGGTISGTTGTFSSVVAAASLTLGTPLAVIYGGTGTTSPALTAGTGISLSGSWPNYTISATNSGTVTSVTASSPLGSSGGTTPNISFTGILGVSNGGTGTSTPSLVAGTNVSITGSWPNQTINATGGSTTYTRTTFTATSGQTSFTVTYTVGSVQVYLNGVFLATTDYTATSGTAIVLATGANAGDIVDVVSLGIISGTVTVDGTTTAQPLTGSYTNRSGSIATANTSQQLAAANGSRRRLFIQNPYNAAGQGIGAAESLYINFTSSAVVNDGDSIEILSGASFDTGTGPVSTELVNIVAATAGHKFIAKEI